MNVDMLKGRRYGVNISIAGIVAKMASAYSLGKGLASAMLLFASCTW